MLTWSKRAWDEVTPDTICKCWWKSSLFPNLCIAPAPSNKRKQPVLPSLNHDNIEIQRDAVSEGPSNLPVIQVLLEIEQLDTAILALRERAVLDEGDDLIAGEEYIDMIGEGSCSGLMEDVLLLCDRGMRTCISKYKW